MKLISIFPKKPFSGGKKKPASSISKEESPSSFGSSTSSLEFSNSTPRSVLPLSTSDVFNLFDRDRDGKITRRELEAVLGRLGPDPLTDEEVTSMVKEVDRDGDGCISLEELDAIKVFAVSEEGPSLGEMREAFRVFDSDGDGNISAEELRGVFEALGEGEECGVEECRMMIEGVDSDGDGFVGFEDFVRMMRGGRF